MSSPVNLGEAARFFWCRFRNHLGETVSDSVAVLDLIRDQVPLALLFDLAGFGPSSEELYHSEGAASDVPEPDLMSVAS